MQCPRLSKRYTRFFMHNKHTSREKIYTFSSYEAVNALHMHFYGTRLSNGSKRHIHDEYEKNTPNEH